jgi:hypothetical protein
LKHTTKPDREQITQIIGEFLSKDKGRILDLSIDELSRYANTFEALNPKARVFFKEFIYRRALKDHSNKQLQ